ncbi:MAG TPA: LysE family transporter [Alphaproteobacteria bacterium]|nr:LysE family transporter [Alphaproteobacteria bacterium]
MLKAFLFGIAIAIAIGPIALLILSTGMTHGLLAGSRVALGAALADFTLASLAFGIGEAATRALTGIGPALPIFSALVLIGFGAWMIRGAARTGVARAPDPGAARGRTIGTFGTLLLTLANPLTIVGFAAFAVAGLPRMEVSGILAHALAVFAGSLCVQMTLAFTGAGLGLALPPRLIRGLNLAGGLGIALFGIWGLASALSTAG